MEPKHELELRSVADVRAAFEACADPSTNLVRSSRLRLVGIVLVVDCLWAVLFAWVFGPAGAVFGLLIPMLTVTKAMLTRASFESGMLNFRGYDRAAYRIETLLRLDRVGNRIRLAFTYGPGESPSTSALEVDALDPLIQLFRGSKRVEVAK